VPEDKGKVIIAEKSYLKEEEIKYILIEMKEICEVNQY
jgi:hypothetical protein